MEEVVEEEPFAILPEMMKSGPNNHYQNKSREVCYWNNQTQVNECMIENFINKANEYNYSVDQALAVLTYNNFDVLKSECDLRIYRPIKGLSKLPAKSIVKLISDGISRNLKSREHRNFDEILMTFPGFTIGDILQSYSQHRFRIKKHTFKVKKLMRRPVIKPFITTTKLVNPSSNISGPIPSTNNSINTAASITSSSNHIWKEIHSSKDAIHRDASINSCLDTQFRLVYQRQFDLINNCSNLEQVIANDLGVIKQYSSVGNDNSSSTYSNGHNENNDSSHCSQIMMKSLDGLLSTVDNESDVTLLTLLRKLNKRKLYQNKYSYNATDCRLSTRRLNWSIDRGQLKNLLDTSDLEDMLNKVDKGCSTYDDAINDSEAESFENLDERLCHFVKHKSVREVYEINPEDEVEEDISFQLLCDRHENILDQFKELLPKPCVFQKLKHTWSNMDFSIFLLGLAQFGKDFRKIADSILTKSETMVRSFYLNFRSEYNLDSISDIYNTNMHPSELDLTNKFIPNPSSPIVKLTKPTAKWKPVKLKNAQKPFVLKEEAIEPGAIEHIDHNYNRQMDCKIKIEKMVVENEEEDENENENENSSDSSSDNFVPEKRVLRSRDTINERYKQIIAEERRSRNRKPTNANKRLQGKRKPNESVDALSKKNNKKRKRR